MAGMMDRLIKEEVEDEEDVKFALQTKQEDSKDDEGMVEFRKKGAQDQPF